MLRNKYALNGEVYISFYNGDVKFHYGLNR